MTTTDENQDRRIEKLEERVNTDERELTALGTKVQLVNDSLKTDIEKTNDDLRERIDNLKSDIKNDHVRINQSITEVDDAVKTMNKSLQNLYITQKGSGTKVEFNEKVIWTIVGIAGAIGLAFIQELLRAGGAG